MPRRVLAAALTLLTFLSLGTFDSSAAPPRVTGPKQPVPPRAATTVDAARRLDAGEFNLWNTNEGSLGFDVATGSPGMFFPRGSANSVLFAAGLWIGAKVLGAPRVTVAEYSQEWAPGRMTGGVPESPLASDLVVFKAARFTGEAADTSHVVATGEQLSADPRRDPLLHHSWSEYVNGAGSRGAPVRSYRLPDTSTPAPDDSVTRTGPDVPGDQMTWCVFNDGNRSTHTNDAGGSGPLGLEVRRTLHTFAGPGILGSTAFMEYQITNRGGQTLQDMMVSLWSDPDLGLFSDDLVGTDPTLGLVYAYNASASDPGYGARPPALGFMILDGPVTPLNDTLRTYSTNRYVNGSDPRDSVSSYNYMLGFNADGSAVVNPVTGLPTRFVFTGDPLTGTGWLDTLGSDKRMMLSTGPITLAPGASTRVTAALIVARGKDRLDSVRLLKRYADFVRDWYFHVDRYARSDLAIVHHSVPDRIHGCEPTNAEFRLVNFGPDTGPFSLSWTLGPVTGFGGSSLLGLTHPGLASGAALDTSIAITLGDTQFAGDLRLTLSADRHADVTDFDRTNNESILSTTHAVPHLKSFAQVSSSPSAQARVRFSRSARDSSVTLSPVLQYELYRRPEGAQPAGPANAARASVADLASRARDAGMLSDPAILAAGWDFVGVVPAHGTSEYSVVVPLLPEVPSPSGYQAFLVRAATATPTLFFDSCVDSMPQVDSLPPLVPANFRVTSVSPAGDVQLAWDPVGSPDLRRYRLHRGTTPAFVPGSGNLLATPAANSFADPGAAPGGAVVYYQLAAEDLLGHQSAFALSGSGTVDVPGASRPQRFELAPLAPNPFSDALSVRYTLPEPARVTLEIFDVSGRLVLEPLRQFAAPAGAAEWRWDGRDARGRRAPPGVYLVRLRAGAHHAVRRVLRLD